MLAPERDRAVTAARWVAASVGLPVDEVVVLQDSNRLTLRLLPGDVVARVAPPSHRAAQFEVDLAQALAEAGCPIATLEPRVEPKVYERHEFLVTLWTHHAPQTSRTVSSRDYAIALEHLHRGMRTVELPTPHWTDRVESARLLLADRASTPALSDSDRALLTETLKTLGAVVSEAGRDQLLHGEPHPGNLLLSHAGPLFIDLETCCRGPVEFDLAHAPEGVGELYSGVDLELLRACRTLVLAMITTWRWDKDDQLPDGIQLGTEWLRQLRTISDGLVNRE